MLLFLNDLLCWCYGEWRVFPVMVADMGVNSIYPIPLNFIWSIPHQICMIFKFRQQPFIKDRFNYNYLQVLLFSYNKYHQVMNVRFRKRCICVSGGSCILKLIWHTNAYKNISIDWQINNNIWHGKSKILNRPLKA